MTTSQPILSVTELRKVFGGVTALDGIDLDVREGEVLGLIGPNGAGKTALLNTITGFYRATSGAIRFMGQDITHMPLHGIGRLGIGRTFQNIRLFKRLTVLENVMAANKRYVRSSFAAFLGAGNRRAALDEAAHWMEFMQLGDKADMSASALSYGDARRLEIARALAGNPALLLLDEPAAGMNEAETDQLVADIQKVRTSGKAIVLIEHDMSLIRSLSDRIVAMDYGKKLAEGDPDTVLEHPDVRRAYLGSDT